MTLEGTLTVLFTDIEGSTDLGRAVGDRRARQIIRAHEEMVRDRVAEHGGRVVKFLGDGCMVAFASARKAVACAIEIQRCLDPAGESGAEDAVPVRIGIHSGEAILEGEDVHGSLVNAAARITDTAKAQQVLVSEIVKTLIGSSPGMRFGDPQPVRLKGFDEEWRVFEVGWREEVRPGTRLTPLVGRDRERAEIGRHLNDLGSGKGALVLIGGEPGVGKTRLAQEIASDGRRRGHRVLTGRCYDVETPIPYLPFIELLEAAAKDVEPATFRIALGDTAGEIAKIVPRLRTLFDDIPPPLELPPEQERRYLFNSIAEFVRRAASTRPLILIVDDLQWADEVSLALLETVAAGLTEVPTLILGTYRNVELDLNRPLARTLDRLLRARLVYRANLKRLSRVEVATMLKGLAGLPPPGNLVDAIYHESDGNPFFVEEVYRHLVDAGRLITSSGEWRPDLEIGDIEVPESIRLVIGRRLEMLTDEARRGLCAASVLGRTFEYPVLEEIAALDQEALLDALETAERVSLVRPLSNHDETRFEFVHELIRQTLLSGMTPPRRQQLHLKAARAMEHLFESRQEERAAEIVNHLRAAGGRDPEAMMRYLTLAGERALQAAAFTDAARYLEEAAELATGDERARARALVGLGHAARVTDSLETAMAHWRRTLEIYETLGDTEAIAAAAHTIVLQLGWDGRWNELMEITGRALASVGEFESHSRAVLLAFGAVGLGWAGEYDQSKQMLDRGLELAESSKDSFLQGECLTAAGTHAFAYGHVNECIELCRRAVEALRSSPAQWNYASAQAFVTMGLSFTSRFDEVQDEADKLEAVSEPLGFGGGMMVAARARMVMENCVAPDVERFARRALEDIEICKTYGLPWLPQGYLFHAYSRFLADDVDAAIAQAQDATREELPGALYGWGLGLSAVMLAYAGRHAEMRRLWGEIEPHLPTDPPQTVGRWNLLSFVAEALWVCGERDRLAGFFPTLAAAPKDLRMRWDGRIADGVTAVAAAAAGFWDEAERLFAEARETVEGLPSHSEIYGIRRLKAMALLERGRRGDDVKARRLLTEALEGFEMLRIPLYERVTKELLAGL